MGTAGDYTLVSVVYAFSVLYKDIVSNPPRSKR
jgi:hypothetical protein